MRDYLEIGSSPFEEDCAQVGTSDYRLRAQVECQAFMDQLRREVGTEPEGAQLRIKRNPHEFGTYLEVVCDYDTESEIALQYALRCEGEGPARWDERAKSYINAQLRERGILV